MSDSSPLLLNMGAELANTAGMNPSITSAPPSAEGGGGEFAAILQSTLAPGSQNKLANPLMAGELEVNPLLLSQLNGSPNPLLPQNEINADDMTGGKDLPLDEQLLAWQTVLAEYDSTDPDTPRLVVATGDDKEIQVEEFSAEDLQTLVSAGNSNEQKAQAPVDLNVETDLQVELPIEVPEEQAISQVPLNPTLNGQDTAKSTQPETMTNENDAITSVVKQQRAHADRNINPVSVESSSNQTDEQTLASQLASDKSGKTLRQENIDSANEAKFRSDLNSAIDGMLAKSNHSSAVNSNTMSGISSYASVSGIGSVNSGSPVSSQVIASLTVPPQNPAWGEVVGDRVQWMVTQNVQEAKIRLNPPELGLLEVRVHVGHDQQTNISFSSPHSHVRDALETAVPRLREMFGDNGLTLGDVNVSHQSMSGQGQGQAEQGDKPNNSPFRNSTSRNTDNTSVVATQQIQASGSGMLDLYA